MKRKIIGVLAALVLAGIGTTALVVYVESAKDEAVAAEALVDVYVVSETIPKGTPAGEITQSVEATQVPARVLVDDAVTDLDGLDGVLTGCAVAIAETGTIVLDGGSGQGRRVLSLVPDYHLVLVTAAQAVASVPEALARLDPTRPQTWISGPSATSDIELDRVEGVHGPRLLHVVIVD